MDTNLRPKLVSRKDTERKGKSVVN